MVVYGNAQSTAKLNHAAKAGSLITNNEFVSLVQRITGGAGGDVRIVSPVLHQYSLAGLQTDTHQNDSPFQQN
jgi:hypothetical protein